MASSKILTVFNIDNDRKCLLITKLAY